MIDRAPRGLPPRVVSARREQRDQGRLDAVRVDFQFHRTIVALAGNELLANLIEVIHEYIMAGMVHTTPHVRSQWVLWRGPRPM